MSKHKLTYVDMHPQPVDNKPASRLAAVLVAAALVACGVVALAAYFDVLTK